MKQLGSAETAVRGNLISSLGMLLAVVVTLFAADLDLGFIFGGLLIGGVIGFIWAKKVQMTGMPELVAFFNGFGGLSSLLVGWAEFAKNPTFTLTEGVEGSPTFTAFAVVFAILIGGITFTGSMIAYLKLSGKMSGSAIVFPRQKIVNGLVFHWSDYRRRAFHRDSISAAAWCDHCSVAFNWCSRSYSNWRW